MTPREVVVGIDGSPAASVAVRWAAIEAASRDASLAVINAYEWWWPGARMALGGEYGEAVRGQAESHVEAAIAVAHQAAPDLSVRGSAVHGQPGRVLVEASVDADMVVVGSRGRGGFASLLLGSVGHQVATHARCPVLVARGRVGASGPIVVGVDGSAPADHALGYAFELARFHGNELLALRCYETLPTWASTGPAYMEDVDERERAERELLHDCVAPWRDKFPDVSVEMAVYRGHPAQTLAGLSHTASIVVVGSRGHGGFGGLLLGSTGLGLLNHADCPVLIDRRAIDVHPSG